MSPILTSSPLPRWVHPILIVWLFVAIVICLAGLTVYSSHLQSEARALLRVTRVEHPDAMLIAPEQSYFLRENLKLRLLNARLALLSRQFDTAQADLRTAAAAIERFYDGSSRRTQLALEQLRQIAAQSRQGAIPLPDDTLAALTAAAGR